MGSEGARRKRKRSTRVIGGAVVVVAAVLIWGSIPQGRLVVTPPPAGADPQRWVHLEGAANTRDAGDYPTSDGGRVKRGMIYRSAKLNRLTSAGAAAYRDLGVTTVIDFCNRLTSWPLFGGDVWSVHLASSVHGCPISFSKAGRPAEFYIRGVRENADSYREAFELLADADNYPVLYHCAAGTDRTGVMSALLLSLLGVQRNVIIADFRLSEQVDAPGDLPAMEALLDEVETAGGIEAFLGNLGATSETQAAIRAILLEKDGGVDDHE